MTVGDKYMRNYTTLACVALEPGKNFVGFGDELWIDFDPDEGKLRLSLFGDDHFKDEAFVDIGELFAGSDE